jgi:hypothetical protein|tara:strand:- start:115 stop:330 length:216 start_codon:yes stop_codon:yes gene_type:complete
MMADNYTKAEAQLDFNDITEHIAEENLQGAAITMLIDDVHEHFEVASRLNFKKSKGHYSALLSRLIKTYGH